MKILCIVDRYHPDSSANTICCDHIANYLKSLGHSVDIMAPMISAEDEEFGERNGSNVIKFPTYYDRTLKKYGKRFNAKKWMDLPWFFRKFMGLKNKLRILTRPATQSVYLDSVDYKYIYNLLTQKCKHYDAIISFSMPFALHVIANKLMKMGLADKWFPLFLDAFVHNKCLNKAKINYRKKVAEKILNLSDKIFMVDGILGENKDLNYNPEYHKKVVEIYIPMLQKLNIEIKKNSGSEKILTYAGLFYHNIRYPDQMLDILSNLPGKYKINIYGDGCEKTVEEKSKQFKESQLTRFGRIGHEECLKAMAESNILLNLGNTITNQMPSKVFEYISFGKPVLNFYFTEEDMCLKVFRKYPLAFNINVNNYTQKDVENLLEFCDKNADVQLSYEEATENLSDYKVDTIVEKIYKVIEECYK